MLRAMRWLLVEDDRMIGAPLREALRLEGHAVAWVYDARAAQAALASERFDIVLLDLGLADADRHGDGLSVLRSLRERGDRTPVLLLTTFDDSDLPLQASEAGAQGFLLKDAAPEDLHEAVLRVAAGETLLAPVSTDPVRARYRFHDEAPPHDNFGEREVAILRLLAGGYSNKEIARSLFLAEGTVKNYVSTILDKLGTRDRTRAVLKAITLRII